MTKKVLLFGTMGCHLCEEAEALVAALEYDSAPIEIELIDIAEQEQWQDKYAIRIPVLYHPQNQAELFWPFDTNELNQFLSELNND